MFKTFQTRSSDTEIIDDLSLDGEVLEKALDYLTVLNKRLGGNQLIRNGIKHIFSSATLGPLIKESKAGQRPLTIADAACGGGDALRLIARLAEEEALQVQLIGLDANAATVRYAQRASNDFANIKISKQDILSDSCTWEGVDILCCNQFLYHLSYEAISGFLEKAFRQGVSAVLINDLQRHWLPYYLFQLLCFLLNAPEVNRLDGGVAIRKAFTRKELKALMATMQSRPYRLNWRWAFRYQLIIFSH
ncbi:MAG: methyltransferase domain-containing protein [Bacteroidota bacterium]